MDSERHFVDAIVSFYTKTVMHNKPKKLSRAQTLWQLLIHPNSKLPCIIRLTNDQEPKKREKVRERD